MEMYSKNLQRDMEVRTFGHGGIPLLAFPTQDGMAGQWEDFGMTDFLKPWLERGDIRLFCVDTVDVESWSLRNGDLEARARRQEAYFRWITEELVPRIGQAPLLTGCSMGGAHSAICLLRRPDLFRGMIGLSGAYDARYFSGGRTSALWLQNSAVDILKHPAGSTLRELRTKAIVLCCGQGAHEDIELDATRLLEKDLRDCGIPAWVEYWGKEAAHDWLWWKPQLYRFLPIVLNELNKNTL